MTVTPEYNVRVGVDRYRALPDGQRKAYMTGLLDMICVAYVYAAGQHKERIVKMVDYAKQFDTDQLSEKFDEYLSADISLDRYGAASIFFIALGKWCGLDK